MREGMHVEMCVDMRVDMRADMCVDMCVDIRVDTHADVCVKSLPGLILLRHNYKGHNYTGP